MSPIKSVLVHIDACERSAVRMRFARDLAVRHDAVVTAMFATYPCMIPLPYSFSDGFAPALMMRERDSALRAQARALFEREGQAMGWTEAVDAPPVAAFVDQALYADLLILGQADPAGSATGDVPSDFVESVLIASGKPAIVLPHAGLVGPVGKRVLIAWKPVPEAARALTAALPLIRSAAEVHLLAADGSASGAIELFLRRHGVETIFHPAPAAVSAGAAGEALLVLAAAVGADLLVMGCYGHSRARELVLGGASRTVLRSMAVPVLMAH